MLLNSTVDNATADLYNHVASREYSNDDQPAHVYVTTPHYFRSLGKLLNHFSKRWV